MFLCVNAGSIGIVVERFLEPLSVLSGQDRAATRMEVPVARDPEGKNFFGQGGQVQLYPVLRLMGRSIPRARLGIH